MPATPSSHRRRSNPHQFPKPKWPPPTSPHLPAVATVVQAPAPSAYNLHVATTGSDSNTGTQAKPFRTITKAASVAKPSTTMHVAAGTYSGNVSTKTSGTSTARIRFVSDTKWGAKIVGSGTEAMWTNNGNYVDITGFDITGPGRLGILNYASYALISGNHVHNLTISGGCSGSGGIVLDNTKVINNIVYANPGASIKEYCYSGAACIGTNNTVANNLVYGNGQGVSMKVGVATRTIAADPKFVAYSAIGTGNYRLKSTSPAVNKGVATSAPAYDIDNIARPTGGALIGAHESF